jgi:hypothetical protein
MASRKRAATNGDGKQEKKGTNGDGKHEKKAKVDKSKQEKKTKVNKSKAKVKVDKVLEPLIESVTPRRFDLGSAEDLKAGLEHLWREGFAVWRDVVPEAEIARLVSLFWDYAEAACDGVDRKDPTTWTNEVWPGTADTITTMMA